MITGLADLQIDEIQVIGIIKAKGGYEAVIAMTDGFPLTAREGDRFADGYVLSIRDGEIVLRKTTGTRHPPAQAQGHRERNHLRGAITWIGNSFGSSAWRCCR